MSKLTKQITAMLLAGMLVIGSARGSVLAASTDVDLGQTSETAQEMLTEEISEIPASVEETSEIAQEVYEEETSEAPADAGETSQVEDTSEELAAVGETAEEASAEEETAAQYYTVTLDANGGYFENEWDDVIGDYAKQTEVVEKHIPVDGTVVALPVFTDQEGQTMVFAGWSLEKDGELITMGDEEYAPVDNCVLYAVWQAEDAALGETGDQEATEENSEQSDCAQDSEEVEDASEETITAQEGVVEEDTVAEANTDPDTENEQAIVPDQEAVSADEDAENTSEESSDAVVVEEETQDEMNEPSQEVETVKEDAANDVVESGTCGDNVRWTLDEAGTLTISGTGNMEDYQGTYNGSTTVFTNPWPLDKIKTIIINYGVTSIGRLAFYECSNLTSVTIPNSVTSIGIHAFESCSDLRSVIIPDSVTWIGSYAFSGCYNLTSVTIPNGVKSIEEYTFSGCNGLTSVTIPDSVTSIGQSAFCGCGGLTSVTIPNRVSNIFGAAFSDCEGLTSVTIPDSVTSIGESAFGRCSNLTSITIPGSVTSIGHNAFVECSSLTSVAIPNGVKCIEEGTFCGCSSLTNVIIPNSVMSIGCFAFGYCSGLMSIEIPNSVMSIEANAFSNCSGLKSVTIPNSVTSIEGWTFSDCSGLTSVTIPDSVTSIRGQAFYRCSNLTSIEIPDSVTSIDIDAFGNCNRLKSITIPNSVERIDEGVFSYCSGLKSVTIPNSVTSIGYIAFLSCERLTSITIPESVTSIGGDAFASCSSLSSIYFKGNAPTIASDAFTNVTATAYYPANDPTWTEDVRQNYGGTITWVEWDPDRVSIPDIVSIVPKNNEVNTDHGIIPQVVFSKALRLSGKGHICLFENNNLVETVEAVEGEHVIAYVNSLDENNITTTLSLTFQKHMSPGKHYSISIDSNSLEYLEWSNDVEDYIGTGTFFEGIDETEWGFSTASLDYMHFSNRTDKIPDYMYDFLFMPIKAWWYKQRDTGEKGTCFGWSYVIGAKKQNYYGINGFNGELSQLAPKAKNRYINHSLLDYIQLAQLYQYSEKQLKEERRTKNQYSDIYNAICEHINGSGPIITIGVDDGENGHQVYPIEIINETSEAILIKVLNCNKPNDTFYDVLKLNKNNGKIIGFELGQYSKNIYYNTVDNILDDVFVGRNVINRDSTKLVYSSYKIESDSINKIHARNGELDESQLYWTEEESITQTVPDGTNIGITDGYTSIEATVNSDATIILDATDNVAHIEPVSEETTNYTLVYGNADEEGNIDEITITSKADKGGVETQQTEDGIVISSEGNSHVEVSDGDNTVGFETSDAPVLVKTDGAITVYEDSNNDGSYTNSIEVAPVGKIKINENSIAISYTHDLTYNDVGVKSPQFCCLAHY